MKTQKFIDKKGWGEGPWQKEPDRATFESHGLPCILRRSPSSGGWCAYVGVPVGHPWHGKRYSDLKFVRVHGGLTYSKECDDDPNKGVCHASIDGDKTWWLGFDHGHAGVDKFPLDPYAQGSFGMMGLGQLFGAMCNMADEIVAPRDDFPEDVAYRDIAYAEAGARKLAKQAAEATK